MNIQWYPGHMTKTRRMLETELKSVDAVCEVVDARIPAASRNPDIDAIAGRLPRLIALNRVDQADPAVTARWRAYFEGKGYRVIETDSKSGAGTKAFEPAARAILAEKVERYAARGQNRALKLDDRGRAERRQVLSDQPPVGKTLRQDGGSSRRHAF